jgi:hypothetical protein
MVYELGERFFTVLPVSVGFMLAVAGVGGGVFTIHGIKLKHRWQQICGIGLFLAGAFGMLNVLHQLLFG